MLKPIKTPTSQNKPINSHQNNQTILITYCIFCIKPVGKPLLLQPTDKPPLCITNGKPPECCKYTILQFIFYKVFWLVIQDDRFSNLILLDLVNLLKVNFWYLLPVFYKYFPKSSPKKPTKLPHHLPEYRT